MGGLSWAGYGLMLALLSALMMLMQERMKVEGLALAIWCKISCAAATLPGRTT